MAQEEFDNLSDKQKAEFFDYIHKQKYEGKNMHDKPSEETKLRLQALELTQKNMMDKIEESQVANDKAHVAIMDSMREFHLSTNASIKDMTDKLDSALEKKADVWVEKAISWAIYLIVGIILTAIIYLVIK